MKKIRLFVKMIVLYFSIIIATLTMLGILLSFLLNNYFIYNKKTELVLKSSNISELIRPFLIEKRDPNLLVTYLNHAEENLGTEMIVVDKQGRLLAGTPEQMLVEEQMINTEDIKKMQLGKINIRQGKSKFYDETSLWVTTPIFDDNNKVIGGITVYSPIIGIKQTASRVKYLFIYSAVVSTIFSTIVVHFMAKYVTSPLSQMNKAVKKMARGDLTQRVSVIQDDEIGDLGRTFNHMATQLEQQEKMKRDFIADVSHELRSPLTNIQGFVEAMIDEKDKTKNERVRYLGIIHKETMRLIRLVNELLELSRIDSGNLEIKKTPVVLTDIINHSINKILPVLKENNRQIIQKIKDPSLVVLGNNDRLEQVIMNLLDNANRYSFTNSNITIECFQKNDDVIVIVTDEGEGISAEELPFIWERFFKVDKARNREKGGTGLGLAIVKQIIVTLGGKVMAESEPGKGSKIGFSLPLYIDHQSV